MSMYGVVVFLHILGALGLFAGIGLEQVSVAQLRQSGTTSQARDWLGVLTGLRRTDGPSGLLILATGIYMMATRWGHGAWMGLAIVGMVLMAILSIAVTGRRARALKDALVGSDAAMWNAVQARLSDPAMRIAATVRAAIGLGIVFNMAVKPPTVGAVTAIGVALAAGALVAFMQVNGRRGALPAAPIGTRSEPLPR